MCHLLYHHQEERAFCHNRAPIPYWNPVHQEFLCLKKAICFWLYPIIICCKMICVSSSEGLTSLWWTPDITSLLFSNSLWHALWPDPLAPPEGSAWGLELGAAKGHASMYWLQSPAEQKAVRQWHCKGWEQTSCKLSPKLGFCSKFPLPSVAKSCLVQ